MVSAHIKRKQSQYQQKVVRPDDEYIKLEIISYEPEYTKLYNSTNQSYTTNNANTYQWVSWKGLTSLDDYNRFEVLCPYNVTTEGEYRVDIIYANRDDRDMMGMFQVFKDDTMISNEDVLYNGDYEYLKRHTFFVDITTTGQYTFKHRLPVNSVFLGCIVRKTRTFTGDNIDSKGTELQFTACTVSQSDYYGADLSATIGYDDQFVNYDCDSGFYFNYRDEVNVYVKDSDGKIQQVFGGYLHSILPDTNYTKLTLTGKDRLIDGEKRYVMEQMVLLSGETEITEYFWDNVADFGTYGQALDYLCHNYETNLQSNIGDHFLVAGETYQDGFTATFGDQGTLVTPETVGMDLEIQSNHIMFRNTTDNTYNQKAYIWSTSDYNVDPIDITDTPIFHVSYGLKDPKTEIEGTGSSDSSTSGSYDTFGVSSDGKTIMAIGKPSAAGELSEYGYSLYCSVFENVCPFCGSDELCWSIWWGSTFPEATDGRSHNYVYGQYEGGSDEGHVFCANCDADFSCINGADHSSPPRAYLNRVSGPDPATEEDAQNLLNGCYSDGSASTSTSEEGTASPLVTSDSIFDSICEEAFNNYEYVLYGNTCSNFDCMQNSGIGDCWAFSDFIYTRLSEAGVGCRILQYGTQYSDAHRSVEYKGSDGEYTNFPYREYEYNGETFATHYNNMLNNTDNAPSGTVIAEYDGGTIDLATVNTSSNTVTVGYDKDNPFKTTIVIYFSVKSGEEYKNNPVQDEGAEQLTLVLNFTVDGFHQNSFSGLNPVLINNHVARSSINVVELMETIIGRDDYVDGKGETRKDNSGGTYVPTSDIDEAMKEQYEEQGSKSQHDSHEEIENGRYYIHRIRFVNPGVNNAQLYDTSTDFSSCKMDFYDIGFNDGTLINPTDLSSCGKSIKDMLKTLVEQSTYRVSMNYNKHRKDDIINFSVDNQTEPVFTCKEGDDSNVLNINSVAFNPYSTLFNNSVCVFKYVVDDTQGTKYFSVNSKSADSVLEFGELTTLITSSDEIHTQEAYYNARHNEKFNPSLDYSYQVSVPGWHNICMGDLVELIADDKKLNDVKNVSSVKLNYSISKIPRIYTDLGLGEVDTKSKLRSIMNGLKDTAYKSDTLFSRTASLVNDKNVYRWEE